MQKLPYLGKYYVQHPNVEITLSVAAITYFHAFARTLCHKKYALF